MQFLDTARHKAATLFIRALIEIIALCEQCLVTRYNIQILSLMYYYTIIFSNRMGNKRVSWLGKTFKTEENAIKAANEMCQDLWDEMPYLSYQVFMHWCPWIAMCRED